MDSLLPGPIKGRMVLDGDVGRIRCESNGVLPQDKGLLVVDTVLVSDEQVTPLLPGRLVLQILVNTESLVGKEVGVCERHGKFKRQVGRGVRNRGKSN